MNTGTNLIGREAARADAWMCAFHAEGKEQEFARLLRIIATDSSDIYTSRLQHTVNLCGALQGGQVKMLRREASSVSFTDLLALLSAVITHSRLARTKVAPILAPGFYIRTEGGSIRPAMPVCHLARISGYKERDLPLLLAPLIQDGAIRMVRDADGHEAVVASDGFADEGASRRFMKF